ncbi:MAG: cobalamin-binding protein [Desulfuromusa sp.]|jgi:iron complex transport system substrate-binding protein|nr:cobalamin-binding protein [Desulfuromusa sp.]
MHKNFILGILLTLIFSCPAAGADFTDALNRQISIPQPPQRIVSLVPSVTEILFKLGLEKRIVAATDFCTYPEAALKLPKVGGYADPSLESILLHQPDLIIASADVNRPSLIRRLELMGIPVFVVYPQTVEDTLTTIQNIGQVTGTEIRSKRLVDSLKTRIQRVQLKIATLTQPTTLACVMLQPLTVAGPDTFVADIIHIAGGQNVVPKGPSRYPTWNTEALLTVNPETVIVSTYPGQPSPKHFFDHWPQLQAVRKQRIIQIEADWIHRPGPRMILGIEALAKALHPEISIDE